AFAAKLAPERWSWGWLGVVVPLAATVVMVVIFNTEPDFSTKGNAVLKVYVREGDRVRELGNEPVKAGSAIQFEVKAQEPGFVSVLGVDGRGNVTVYFPYGKTQSAPYDPRAPLLSQAIELDDAPGAEELYLLYSQRAFDAQAAVDALKNKVALEDRAPEGISVSRATVKKR
ncbi:MAG: DUF4384 domain-containing protein, partial [Myxococcaceae bacterium]